MIRRAFTDVNGRQVHYRHAGSNDAQPLLLIHSSPGSAKQLEPLLERLGRHRRVIAPDTPGNGDSPPLPIAVPEIGDYAEALVGFMDAVGLETVDVYGSHTGASIAAELAILATGRVVKVIMNGIGFFPPEEAAEYLANYALARKPDVNGAYLAEMFLFCRDQYLFFPWYARDKAHGRSGTIPPADVLHDWVLETLKALKTYHLAYNASFRYPAGDRLHLVNAPTLMLLHDSDPLVSHSQNAAALMPNAAWRVVSGVGAQGVDDLARETLDFLA